MRTSAIMTVVLEYFNQFDVHNKSILSFQVYTNASIHNVDRGLYHTTAYFIAYAITINFIQLSNHNIIFCHNNVHLIVLHNITRMLIRVNSSTVYVGHIYLLTMQLAAYMHEKQIIFILFYYATTNM